MSITIDINGVQLKSTKENLQDTITHYITNYNLILKDIIFAGKKFENYTSLIDEIRYQNNVIVYLTVYPIITDPYLLFYKLKKETGGWQDISKSKPVATLNSGFNEWFTYNYNNFSSKQKDIIKNLITMFLAKKNGYVINIDIYEPSETQNQYFFFSQELLEIASKIIDLPINLVKEYITNPYKYNDDPKKMLLIYLVFGDYYKSYFTDELTKNDEFMKLLHTYNNEVGLSNPELINDLVGSSINNQKN